MNKPFLPSLAVCATLALALAACQRAESPAEVNADVAEAQEDRQESVADARADQAETRADTAEAATSRDPDDRGDAIEDRAEAQYNTAIAEARPGLSTTQREALETLRETRTLVSQLRAALDEGGGVSHLVRNLNLASENFARLSARLERDPSSVVMRRALPAKPSGPPIRD